MGKIADFFMGVISPADVEEEDNNEYFVNENEADGRNDYADDRRKRNSGNRTRVVNVNQNSDRSRRAEEYSRSQSTNEGEHANISLCVPTSYNELKGIVEKVMRGEHVIIKFDQIDKRTGQRILDYVSGTAYALDAHVSNVSKSVIYLVTPKDTKLDETLLNNSKQNIKDSKTAPKNSFVISDEDDF